MSIILIFQFSSDSDLSSWRVVDDVVMGGESSGSFFLNEGGNGEFSGTVSLENNGGFSSVHYATGKIEIKGQKKIRFRVRGDGKMYQFRIKEQLSDQHSYTASFRAPTEWQDIVLPLEAFYPGFRGRKLDMPNFAARFMEGIAILIGNKKSEAFRLEISRIELL